MKSHSELEKSPVVANNAMNRKRQATGENSYAKDVGLDPLSWLRKRQQFPVSEEPVRWLDLCCGEGRALLEVSQKLSTKDQPTELIGLDLVAMFTPELQGTNVRLKVDSVHTWEPTERFDLITCVHGLHYLGDKLDVLQRAAGWLKPTGLFAANLDPSFLVDEAGCSLARPALRLLKEAGFDFDHRKKVLQLESNQVHRVISFPFTYVGALDDAGPNYTGQPAVKSVYSQHPS